MLFYRNWKSSRIGDVNIGMSVAEFLQAVCTDILAIYYGLTTICNANSDEENATPEFTLLVQDLASTRNFPVK